jgi:hypothetical protein
VVNVKNAIRVGDVIYELETGPSRDPQRPHWFVIIRIIDNDVLLVPISSLKRQKQVCVINPRDFPRYLNRPSYASYRFAKVVTSQAVV